MKLISWNVAGLRACIKKGFHESLEPLNADIIALQEVKAEQSQVPDILPGYHPFWNSAEKKGYSGVAVFTRAEPLSVSYGMGIDEHDHEGRMITLEFNDFFLISAYVPNAQRDLARLPYRMRWEDDFRAYALSLNARKPVVICGDMNVAHTEIDIKHPKSNQRSAGFTIEERGKMTELLAAGFSDTFRTLHPDARDAYTWWSYMPGIREKNVGWRIDYFIASTPLMERVRGASIHPNIMGSDHCPIGLEMEGE